MTFLFINQYFDFLIYYYDYYFVEEPGITLDMALEYLNIMNSMVEFIIILDSKVEFITILDSKVEFPTILVKKVEFPTILDSTEDIAARIPIVRGE